MAHSTSDNQGTDKQNSGDEAELSPAETLKALIKDASFSFRLGMEAKGNAQLIKVVDNLMELLQQGKVNVDIQQLNANVKLVMTAQANADFIYVADILDYELTPAINE